MNFFSFLRLRRNIVWHNVESLSRQSLLKILFVGLAASLFLSIEFVFSYHVFRFIRDFPGVGSIMSERLMFLFYFALFFMLIFSNAIVSYSTIYRSKETELLFSLPVSSVKIFGYKFLEANILSSWAFLILLVPFMTSYGLVNHANPFFYILIIIFFIPFLVIAGILGSFFTMLLLNILPRKNLKPWIIFSGLGVVAIIFLLIRRITFEERVQNLEVFILSQLLPNIKFSRSPFLPNYWMAEGMIASAIGNLRNSLFYLLLLISNAAFSLNLLFGFANKSYLNQWYEAHSHIRSRIFELKKGLIERLRIVFRPFGLSLRGLIIKDMKLFWRDPVQWTQFVIFFGLLGVYFVNIRNLSYNLLESFWKNLCAFLNLAATLLTLGSLSTRFVFPQLSLEGNKFWIIGLAPLNLRDIIMEKFWMSLAISLFITELLVITSNLMLGITGLMMSVCIIVVFIMNLALIGLSVGLGAAFPNFKSENPATIVSGFGGTLTLILSISYIILTIALIATPFQLYLKGNIGNFSELKRIVSSTLVGIGILGLVLCILPLWYGKERLSQMEF